ncbi:MAG: hypothetical protein M1816_005062 [Peltula sp. TS41687]|nr:MAG: hypothetical protein M1816_005062 [Peltula sp. TS41687]
MRQLKQWIETRLRDHHQSDDDGKRSSDRNVVVEDLLSTIPKRPSSRPRALTVCDSAVAHRGSRFFTMLPPSIREEVYRSLFGHRTIHLDLRYDHADQMGARHANLGGGPHSTKDTSTPKRWRWWSCVCHRMQKELDDGQLVVLDFWLDRCRWAEQTYCQWSASPDRSDCFVWALGWLLSCRQAYSEGICILYSTNTFHLGEQHRDGPPPLFRNVESLLLPQRLASMRSLELIWNFDHFGRKSTDRETGKPVFETLLDILTSSLPNLRDVRIAVQTQNYYQPQESGEEAEESLLSTVISPMDQMVGHFGTQLRRHGHTTP